MKYLNDLLLQNWQASSSGSTITGFKSEGGVIGTHGALNDGDYILNFQGNSSDGTISVNSGRLTLVADNGGGTSGLGVGGGSWEMYVNNWDDGTEYIGQKVLYDSNSGDVVTYFGLSPVTSTSTVISAANATFGTTGSYMVVDSSGISANRTSGSLAVNINLTPRSSIFGPGAVVINGIMSVSNIASFAKQLQITEIATPSTPPTASTLYVYPKSDDNLYIMNSAGVESKLLTSGGSTQRTFAFFMS